MKELRESARQKIDLGRGQAGDFRRETVATRAVQPAPERDRGLANPAHQRERLGSGRLRHGLVEQIDQKFGVLPELTSRFGHSTLSMDNNGTRGFTAVSREQQNRLDSS